MQELDLQNSFDVLSIARSWPRVDVNALDLAARLRTQDDIASERDRIERAIPALRSRQRFWEGMGSLGLIVCCGVAGLAAFVAFDWFSLRQPLLEHVGTLAPKVAVILAVFLWLLMLHFAETSFDARKSLDAKLDLLTPVVDGADCIAAAEAIESGRPDVLAWRDIAMYDRKVLFAFDVAILNALLGAALTARSPAEKAAAGAAAYQALYGAQPTSRKEGASHDA